MSTFILSMKHFHNIKFETLMLTVEWLPVFYLLLNGCLCFISS